MSRLGIASLDLSLLSYFNIDIDLARKVLYSCEQCDSVRSHRIDIQAFCSIYAPQSKYLMRYLWNVYYLTKFQRSILIHRIEWSDIAEYSPTYAEFLPFLFFIICLKDRDILRFLYWIHFNTYGCLTLSIESLLQLSYRLWIDSLDKYDNYKLKLQFQMSQRSDFRDFDMYVFIIYNLKCNGVFIKPILALQSSIKQTFIGHSFWLHISERYKHIYAITDESLQLFEVLKQNIHPGIQSTDGIAQAEEIIRKFVHFLSEFKDSIERHNYQQHNLSLSSKSTQVVSLQDTEFHISLDWIRKFFLRKSKLEYLLQRKPPNHLLASYDRFNHLIPREDDSVEEVLAKAERVRMYAMDCCKTSIEQIETHMDVSRK